MLLIEKPASVIGTAEGYTRPALQNFFMTRYTPSCAARIVALNGSLVNDSQAQPAGEDGLIVLKIADACMRPVSEGTRIAL